ncbi:MAG: hypothetical protein JWP91_4262 [Fibrobacteres bacterium]|nr:hypothetical protein [Fibrobacterota bacterium]
MKKIAALLCAIGLHHAWSAAGLYVKTPSAAKAYVFDARRDKEDARISALCLGGMINQTAAEAYVITRDHDREQLEMSKKPFEVLPPVVTSDSMSGLRTLWGAYQGRVKKIFLYDPKKDWSFYLAMMASSQQAGVPLTSEMRDSLLKGSAWAGTVEDFRTRWTGRIPAYDWALENLMPNCTRKSVFVIKYHFSIPLFDYAVAAKGFVFWLDFDNPAETAEIEKILQAGKYAVGASLMGYANVEDHANKVANKFGIGYVASDYYANGSFWASFPNKTYAQPMRPGIVAEKGKVYVCFLWSDGDNIQFDQNGIYAIWKDPARGTIPVGTPLNPGLQELNPPLMDFFYDNKKPNDELISGPCGFQFIYTVFFSPSMYPGWLDINKKWLADAGFHAGSLWWTTYPTPEYDSYTRTCGLEGLFHNYGQPFTKPLFQNGVALFNEYIKERRNADSVYKDLAGVASNAAEPQFRAMKVITPDFVPNGYAKLKAVADSLNRNFPNKYVFMLPTAFINTAKAWYGQPAALAQMGGMGGMGGVPLRDAGKAAADLRIRVPGAYFQGPSGSGVRDAAGRKPLEESHEIRTGTNRDAARGDGAAVQTR